MEVIVPHAAGMTGIEALRRENPQVRFLEVSMGEEQLRGNSLDRHGVLLSRGIAIAKGEIVALVEDHDVVAPDWGARVVAAHSEPAASVGGAIENGVDKPLNWAVYFCDFGRYQNPLPRGDSQRASDANVSYKRQALEKIADVWRGEFHEASVNRALLAAGERIVLVPEVVVYQHRQDLRLRPMLMERYVWGRTFGAWRTRNSGLANRLAWAIGSPLLPILLVTRMGQMAVQRGRAVRQFMRALPWTTVLSIAWSWGELAGYITGKPHRRAGVAGGA